MNNLLRKLSPTNWPYYTASDWLFLLSSIVFLILAIAFVVSPKPVLGILALAFLAGSVLQVTSSPS